MKAQILPFESLNSEDKELILAARNALANSYSIYSGYAVGAAVKTIEGQIFYGVNVENASYGLSVCAEVSAITAALSAGEKHIIKIAVSGASEIGLKADFITPCGRCRQLIYEAGQISGIDISVLCSNTDSEKVLVTSISELLPLPFGPADLGLEKLLNSYRK